MGEPQSRGLAVIAPLTDGDLHNNFVKGCLVVRIAAPPSPARAWRRCASSIAERARRLSLLRGRGGWEERGCPGGGRRRPGLPCPNLRARAGAQESRHFGVGSRRACLGTEVLVIPWPVTYCPRTRKPADRDGADLASLSALSPLAFSLDKNISPQRRLRGPLPPIHP